MLSVLRGVFHQCLPVVLATGLAMPALIQACPVCYGKVEGPTNAAINAAILLLIGITGLVLGGIAGFFLRMRRFQRRQEGLSKYVVTDEGDIVLKGENEPKALSR
ncbi:MAG: hypothetical protein D6715_00590 [Calditrichaeota bacterium]|nr:MAG: hypothetical protein D6715_00590 [Calditrichota bacterium]